MKVTEASKNIYVTIAELETVTRTFYQIDNRNNGINF